MTSKRQRRSLPRVTAALTMVVSLLGCGGERPSRQDDAHAIPPSNGAPAGASIFDLELPLIDHEGTKLTLADLGGHVMLAAMVYTSCTSVCVLVTEDMKAIERQLSGTDDGVRFVLFSLDPGRDTPAAMRQFAANQRLDTTRWRLVAASEDGVRDLAAVLDVKYRAEEDGEIAHSAMIFVIDREGVVRHRQLGVGRDAEPLKAALAQARR